MSEVNDRNTKVIEMFRASGGKLGGFSSLLLLHTIGAKSGLERVNPTAFMRDGARLVVVASDSGAPNNPGWYYNIKANPLVTVEVGTETFQALATITEEPERSQLYDRMAASMPGYDEYRHKTSRVIPVIVLTPVKVGESR